MQKQEMRNKIEKIAILVEQQEKDTIIQKDEVLKQITEVLRQHGQEYLICQLQQLQYLLDDAMFLSVYQAAIKNDYLPNGELVS